MNKDGRGVTLKLFISAPYDRYVNGNTRFWDASGIDMSLDANGIKIETQSLVSIMFGGLAFDTPSTSDMLPPAEPNTAFGLFANRGEAMKNPDRLVDRYSMTFSESVRGLTVGAPVEVRGIVVGEVVAIHTQLDAVRGTIGIPVRSSITRSASPHSRWRITKTEKMTKDSKALVDLLVAHGLRAQLRPGDLLSGQLYIAMDFFPHAPKAKVNWTTTPPELPTTPGALTDLQATLGDITRKLDKVDVEGISTDLRKTLQSTNKLMLRLDTELTPQASAMLEEARRALGTADRALGSADRLLQSDSPLQQDTRATMQDARAAMEEAARAAQAIRLLSDYLERHPEALIRGKKEDEK